MLKVLVAGLWTSVQDLGRSGYRHFGVPQAGVMDTRSSRLANLLLNNSEDAAVIEMSMTGPVLEFGAATRIALTGADMSPNLNAHDCAMNKIIDIKAGDRLAFARLKYGLRTYLAIDQGFQTPIVMESRSFYSNITEKVKLESGDILVYKELCPSSKEQQTHAAVKLDKLHFSHSILEVYPGPEYEKLDAQQKELLLTKQFTLSVRNNRMAYQIEELIENSLDPILTSAVMPGTVQLTPSGKLLILMRDCQTTGGYPRVLQLAERAINHLAQKKSGDKVNFQFEHLSDS